MQTPTPRSTFPKQYRLVLPRQFSRVFKRNQRSSDELFTVLARTNTRGHPRLGMAISRKSAGAAPCRNRIKRQIRESFRHARHLLPPVDLVVMAKPAIRATDNRRMQHSLERHWRRILHRCQEPHSQ